MIAVLSGTPVFTITITWAMFKWAGLPLLIGSFLSLLFGNLPDHYGSPLANGLRWAFWPLSMVWCLVIFFYGLYA
jgi:hypothetical protein